MITNIKINRGLKLIFLKSLFKIKRECTFKELSNFFYNSIQGNIT